MASEAFLGHPSSCQPPLVAPATSPILPFIAHYSEIIAPFPWVALLSALSLTGNHLREDRDLVPLVHCVTRCLAHSGQLSKYQLNK